MDELQQFGLVVLVIFSIIALLIFILYQFGERKSFTRRTAKAISTKVKEIRKRNTLYGCESCARYYRLYQLDLLKKDDIYRCPHCNYKAERGIHSKTLIGEVRKPDKWMDSHSDCFKVSLKQYFMILNTARKVKKLREEEESLKRFEEYNQLSTDMSWIEKLHNKNQ